MNYNEILLQKDKTVIPSIEGTVSKISKPKDESELSEGQKKAGIHPQFLTLTDSDGVSIDCQIIKKNLHLPKDIYGKVIRVESGNNDGTPIGLKVNAISITAKAWDRHFKDVLFRDVQSTVWSETHKKKEVTV